MLLIAASRCEVMRGTEQVDQETI